jgi:hypothetical protein
MGLRGRLRRAEKAAEEEMIIIPQQFGRRSLGLVR